MRILIIEDDPKTAHYLRQGLTESGFIVDCIQNGIDGINLVSQQAYDCSTRRKPRKVTTGIYL
jgi:two-component system copper resistance phosphate regulon response regulator CusR